MILKLVKPTLEWAILSTDKAYKYGFVPSTGTIKSNGGVLKNEVYEDGELVQRYWIEVSKL